MKDKTDIFMTTQEKTFLNEIIDVNKFWLYGDKEACFKEDCILMVLLALRYRRPQDIYED